jgi:hypothetical protein
MRGQILSLGIAVFISVCLCGTAFAGNLQLMSEKMAKQDLRRNIMEAVIGYKVKSEGQFGLTEEANYNIKQKAAAVMKGVIEDRIVYDKNKDICICTGHLELSDVQNILGEKIRYKNVQVRGVGFGTMSPQYRPYLLALRAALVNAYDEMANLIVGQKISSYSEVDNFVLSKDSNKSKVCAAIYGAHIPNVDLDSKERGWGWDDTGNAFVKLTMDLGEVKDILGARIIYKGSNVIEVTGRGAQVDELKTDTSEQVVDKGNAPQESEPAKVEVPGLEPAPPK